MLHQDFIRVRDDEFYVYHTCERTPLTDALFDAFSLQSLLVVFPMEYHDDGSATVSVVGPRPDVETVLADVPEEIDVDIEAVGGPAVRDDGVVSRLSDRQREALEVGIDLGYYDTPRGATGEDVAEAMDCAPSTAARHLRKAESKLLTGLMER